MNLFEDNVNRFPYKKEENMKPKNGLPIRSINSNHSINNHRLEYRRMRHLVSTYIFLFLMTSRCGCYDNSEQSKVRLEISEEIPIGSVVTNLLNHVNLHGNEKPEATQGGQFSFLLVAKNRMHEQLFQLEEGFSDDNPSSSSSSQQQRPRLKGNGILTVKSRIDREILCRRRNTCEVKFEVEVARSRRSRNVRDHEDRHHDLDDERKLSRTKREVKELKVKNVNYYVIGNRVGYDDDDEENKRADLLHHQQWRDNAVLQNQHRRRHLSENKDTIIPKQITSLPPHGHHGDSSYSSSSSSSLHPDHGTTVLDSAMNVSRHDNRRTKDHKIIEGDSNHVSERSDVNGFEAINHGFISHDRLGSLRYASKNNSKNNNDDDGGANLSRVKRDPESEIKQHVSAGIPSNIPKIRTSRDYFFQIIEIIIVIADINDNPPQFVVDESDLSLARSAAETSLSELDRISKWENETELSFSVYVAENSPKGNSFVIPCYVEDPDVSDHVNQDGHTLMTFEHEGNCSDLIRFSVKTESESETYLRRGKRSDLKSFHDKNQLLHNLTHRHHHNLHPHHHLRHHHNLHPHHDSPGTPHANHHQHHLKRRIRRQHGTTTSLWLTILQELDRESIDRCHIDVRAKDTAGNVGKLLRLRVIVTDVNDNKPVFESETTKLEIPEDRPPSLIEPILKVKASDLDIGENGRIVYTFARGTQTSLGWIFHIDSDSGKIFLKSRMNTPEAASAMSSIIIDDITATSLDDDRLRSTSSSSTLSSASVEARGFKLRVVASNPVPGSVTSSQHDVIVVPTDVNDHSPHVRISPDPIEVIEEAESVGHVVGHVMVEDVDSGENGRTRCAFSNWSHLHRHRHLHYHQEEENEEEDYEKELNDEDDHVGGDDDNDDYEGSELFRLIRVSEKMYRMVTRKRFDREKRAKFKVTLFCWDHGTPRLSTSREITVVIRDINDNWPTFRQKSYQVSLAENNHVGAAILKVMADDADEGANARIVYSISAKSNNGDNDTINNKDVNNNINRTNKNINKNSEKISSLASTKPFGNLPIHSFLTMATTPSYDDDSIESMFSIDGESGIIYAVKSFDYEAAREFHFYVLASDTDRNGDKRRDGSGETYVTVNILDVNDEPPMFSSEKHEFFVVENGPSETEVGIVMVTDADASPEFVNYNLTVESSFPPPTSGGSFFHLDETTGRLVTSRTLDREQYSVHHLWLVVRNTVTPHLSSTSHVIVHVTDTNDNAPLVEYPSPGDHSVQVRCSANPGNIVARIRARDADAGENATLEYFVAKGNDAGLISIETKSGLVTLARSPLDLLEFKMVTDRQNTKRTTDEFFHHSNWTNGGVDMKFEVVFVVRDQGEPPKSAETRLKIAFNCSLAELQRRTGKDTKSDEFLNFLVNSSGFQSESFKKMFTNELIVAIFGAITAVLLVVTILIVCVRLRRNSRSGHRSLDRNNSKSGLSDSDFKLNISNKMTSQMTSPVSASENHYHVTPGATRLTSGGGIYQGNHHGDKCSDVHSSVKEDNIKNEMLLMNRSKMDDDDVINNKMAAEDDVINNKIAVKGYDYHTSQTLEKNNKHQANGMKSFSPPPRSDHGSLTKKSEVSTPATTSSFSTFFSPPPPAPPPSHSTCCMEKKQPQQQCNNYMQQQYGYHGNTFQKNQMRPSLKLLRQELTLTDTDKRKESLVSANEVNRLLDILKNSHDNQGHYSSCDWPPIEDFNQSDIIWGQCVDDVIDDYDICNPEYEKL